ncbi:MAG: PD40 domain-containing protein, partial [Chrysiogenetes bacterium]|nr:PD40 domain-containing protein [Chrysiogenetes bacterium]
MNSGFAALKKGALRMGALAALIVFSFISSGCSSSGPGVGGVDTTTTTSGRLAFAGEWSVLTPGPDNTLGTADDVVVALRNPPVPPNKWADAVPLPPFGVQVRDAFGNPLAFNSAIGSTEIRMSVFSQTDPGDQFEPATFVNPGVATENFSLTFQVRIIASVANTNYTINIVSNDQGTETTDSATVTTPGAPPTIVALRDSLVAALNAAPTDAVVTAYPHPTRADTIFIQADDGELLPSSLLSPAQKAATQSMSVTVGGTNMTPTLLNPPLSHVALIDGVFYDADDADLDANGEQLVLYAITAANAGLSPINNQQLLIGQGTPNITSKLVFVTDPPDNVIAGETAITFNVQAQDTFNTPITDDQTTIVGVQVRDAEGDLIIDNGMTQTVCTSSELDPAMAPCRFTLVDGEGSLPNLYYTGSDAFTLVLVGLRDSDMALLDPLTFDITAQPGTATQLVFADNPDINGAVLSPGSVTQTAGAPWLGGPQFVTTRRPEVHILDAIGNIVDDSVTQLELVAVDTGTMEVLDLDGAGPTAASSGVLVFDSVISERATVADVQVRSASGVTRSNELHGLGDGATTNFSFTLEPATFNQNTIMPTTVRITDGIAGITQVIVDTNGDGTLYDMGTMTVRGTVDYDTGDVNVLFGTAPANGQQIVATYSFVLRLDDPGVVIQPDEPTQLGFPQYPLVERPLTVQEAGALWQRGIPQTTTGEALIYQDLSPVTGDGGPGPYGTAMNPIEFINTLSRVVPGSVQITAMDDMGGTLFASDNGVGGFNGNILPGATIDYETGQIVGLTFSSNVMNASAMSATYDSLAGAPIILQVQDQFGNLVDDQNAQIVATLSSGTGNLLGTTTVNTFNGEAVFGNLRYDLAEVVTVLFTDAGGNLTARTTGPITITPSTGARIVFGTPPRSSEPVDSVWQGFTIEVQDQFGNLVATDNSSVIELTLSAPGGTLSQGMAVAAPEVIGVGTGASGQEFSAIALASSPVVPNSITLTADPGVFQQVATDDGVGNFTGGDVNPDCGPTPSDPDVDYDTGTINCVEFSRSVPNGTNVEADYEYLVNCPGNICTETVQNGVATFDSIAYNTGAPPQVISVNFAQQAGPPTAVINNQQITITPRPDHLTFVTEPPASATKNQPWNSFSVEIRDASNNLVPGANNLVRVVKGAHVSPANLSGTLEVQAVNGVATFTNVVADEIAVGVGVDAIEVEIESPGLTGLTQRATMVPIAVEIFGAPSALVFAPGGTPPPQPDPAGFSASSADSGGFVFDVRLEDSAGNLLDSVMDFNVTMNLKQGNGTLQLVTGTGVETCPCVQTVVAGVATFDGVIYDVAPDDIIIEFTGTGVSAAEFAEPMVGLADPDHMEFTIQPPTITQNGVGMSYFAVSIIDEVGNVDITRNTETVTMSIAGVSDGVLSGTLTRTFFNGVAVFNDVAYTFNQNSDSNQLIDLQAATNLPDIPPATSITVDVQAAPGAQSPIARVSTSGVQATEGNGASVNAVISHDGRWVAFESVADDLANGDGNSYRDIILRDMRTTTTVIASGGGGSDGASFSPSISGDGRFVAFSSDADNLSDRDSNGRRDIYVFDRLNNMVELISATSGGQAGAAASDNPAISADGRYVAFDTQATNLATGGATTNNANREVLVRDRYLEVTQRVSGELDTMSDTLSDVAASSVSRNPAISATGRYIAYESNSDDIIGAGDTNGQYDIFVLDRDADGDGILDQDAVLPATDPFSIVRVSVDDAGAEASGGSTDPAISADGRFVAFASAATDLIVGDTNGFSDIFLHDRDVDDDDVLDEAGFISTVRVSESSGGAQANAGSTLPSISANGNFITFESVATNLVSGDSNGVRDIFVNAPSTGGTSRVSLNTDSAQGDAASNIPFISGDGRYITFHSAASNLVVPTAN